jgi:hypothetical protein
MIAMKINYKQNVRLLWILASVAVLSYRFDNCVEMAEGCYRAEDSMFLSMFLLSFPGSLLYLIFLAFTFDSIDVYTPLHYLLLWGGAFTVGYFQWFWFIPRLLRGQAMTTLGLSQSGTPTVGSRVGQRSSSPRARKRASHLKGRSLAHFDEIGRTPLERAVIDNHI